MSNPSLSELVRDQISAEGPDELSGPDAQEEYIDEALNAMSHVELLERISDAMSKVRAELTVSLGL